MTNVSRRQIHYLLSLIIFLQLFLLVDSFLLGKNLPSCSRSTKRRIEAQQLRAEASVPSIRLNKVLKKSHSRRQADQLIAEGRVKVNGETSFGCMVVPHQDEVRLDDVVVNGWEVLNNCIKKDDETAAFEYIKFWKPRGVVCTTDQRIEGNIIDEITRYSGYNPPHRVYPVGRLDKDSSGLILLTSDGRLPNASLRGSQKQPKVYNVRIDRPLTDEMIELLSDGVVITTIAQRDGRRAEPLTARTKPCVVNRLSGNRACQMVLTEGRNRQIRKMMTELGARVVNLHRVQFGEISIDDLQEEGDWKRLNQSEMAWIDQVLDQAEIDHV